MSGLSVLVFVVVGAAGAAIIYLWRELEQLRAQLADQKAVRASLETRLEAQGALSEERDAARQEAARAREALAALQAGEAARAEAAAQREQALLAMKVEVEKSFSALAADALSRNEQRFLALANESFDKHRAAAQGQVKEAVDPVKETFARLAESVAALDKSRTEDKATLSEQLRAVAEQLKETQGATGKLVNALRAAPKTRGRWGEETLRNVLEMAGLASHVDFEEQTTVAGESGRLRPDVTIRLPGGRVIVVDSKVALSAYLEAFEAVDDQARETHLKRHAAQLREHVRLLASKDYWRHVPESADFVALFVPGENFFAAAAERDPELFEYAIAARVIIVTPATLVALAKAVAYGWRQEEAAKNAKLVAELGRELYQRLSRMGEAVAGLGRAMEGSVKKYNDLVGSLEGRVLPQARKLRELGAGDGGVEIAALEPMETHPRRLTAGRDLLTGLE